MRLEELLYKRISGAKYGDDVELAWFDGTPAVFFGPCPEDADTGWGDNRQYPRISYTMDLRGDPDRQTTGTLYADIWCTEDGPAPECFEPVLRSTLCGVIMAPDGVPPCSFVWRTSDTFRSNKETDPVKVIGVTVSFDMYSFPGQETTDPDPVLAMCEYFRTVYPEVSVINQITMPDFTEPSEERPAVYVRLGEYEIDRETHVVAWMNGQINCHVFAPGAAARRKWIKAITDDLSCRGEVIMLDDSPMFFRSVKADTNMDPLSYGQIQLGVQWGILRPQKYAHTMIGVHSTIKNQEEV